MIIKILTAVIVLLLIFGFLGLNIIGGFIHILIIIALVLFLIRTIQSKNEVPAEDHHQDSHH